MKSLTLKSYFEASTTNDNMQLKIVSELVNFGVRHGITKKVESEASSIEYKMKKREFKPVD